MRLQQTLFDHIRSRMPKGQSLVNKVAELLHCSEDSAYRRLRCDTQISLDEAYVLAAHFNISIDELFETSNHGVLFRYNSVQSKEMDIAGFFKGVSSLLNSMMNGGKKQILHGTMDIPFYHYFHSPELSLFKLYFWSKSLWENPGFAETDFSLSHMTKVAGDYLDPHGKNIIKCYMAIPSVEIWSEDTINSTLKQIEFYLHSGLFKQKEDCRIICECLCNLLDHIKTQAEYGVKFAPGLKPIGQPGDYKVFLNEVLFVDNVICTEVDDLKTVYLLHESMNILTTTNQQFCNETYDWLQSQLKRANKISEQSEKLRNNFFYSQIKKVENLIQSI